MDLSKQRSLMYLELCNFTTSDNECIKELNIKSLILKDSSTIKIFHMSRLRYIVTNNNSIITLGIQQYNFKEITPFFTTVGTKILTKT